MGRTMSCNTFGIKKTVKPAWRPRENTPSAFGIAPKGGDGPMDRSNVFLN